MTAIPAVSAASTGGAGDRSRATAAQPITAAMTIRNTDWPSAARSSTEVWPKAWSSSGGRAA